MTMKFIFIFAIFLVFSIGVNSFYVVCADQAIGKPVWEMMSDKVCEDKLCSDVDDSDYVKVLPSSIVYFSPQLKQISQGIDPSNVTSTDLVTYLAK